MDFRWRLLANSTTNVPPPARMCPIWPRKADTSSTWCITRTIIAASKVPAAKGMA